MRSDISKLSFDESNHYLAVFHQMGRVPLESDWNEQNELMLRLTQRVAGDAIRTGSPNHGFRVDTHLLLDACDSRKGWVSTPANAPLFVDYFDHRVGDGSLVAAGVTAIVKPLESPLDLSGLDEVLVHVKGVFAAGALTFFVGDGAATHAFTMTELAAQNGWRVFRAQPSAWPGGFAPERIQEYGFRDLDVSARYAFDAVRLGARIQSALIDTGLEQHWTYAPAGAIAGIDDDARLGSSLALKVTLATELVYRLPAPRDLSRARALEVPLRRSHATAPFNVVLIDGSSPAHSVTLTGAAVSAVQGWEVHRFTLPQAGAFDWQNVVELRFESLSSTRTYWFAAPNVEVNPARDLIIMGGDGTASGAGRFYADGLVALKERHESYSTQRDLPLADAQALEPVTDGKQRIDWAYLDVWERPLTYVERPSLRDIVLEGQDTTTRTQLVAQVRLLKGDEIELPADPVPPEAKFASLPSLGFGTLTTKDKPAATLDPCADPCEPQIQGPYLGEGDRLFRVEIHLGGDIGPAGAATTAVAKWSADNGAVATSLLEDALAGATSAIVEKPDLFAVGDLIELSDDLVELITGPYEDRVTHRAHRRGEMRRVVTVNLQTRRISWADPAAADPALHAPLPQPMRIAYHAKLTKWDGMFPVVSPDITLTDGVTIEAGGHGFVAGTYWLFTTRVVDRSVERLIEAPPRGIRHRYYKLASILRRRPPGETETVIVEDLRTRFVPLPDLDASRIAYDPGAGAVAIPGWDKVGTVQEAIDAIALADLNADMRLHHRLLHGYGVICGLKLRCSPGRRNVVLGRGYALDCEGYTLHVARDRAVDVVDAAAAQNLLDNAGNAKVNLIISRDAGPDPLVEIEPHMPQGFWDGVLEGTLLKDFYDKVILSYINFIKGQFTPFPDTTVPLSVEHQRVLACINLFWQIVNSSSGPYIFVSPREHELLEKLYLDLRNLLASKTFCGMFDSLQPFPKYPYPMPDAGIDTLFGMFLFHHRVKLSPDGAFAYTCGVGNRIQVFDLAKRELVEVLTFPGATNLNVMDIVFRPDGTELYAVALMSNSTDSIFATASIGAGQTHTWGPATVVCDIRFVKLAMHAKHAGTLYAIGRSATDPTRRGLYTLIPNAISLTPLPAINFNATGSFEIDEAGERAYAGASTGGTDTDNFNRVVYITLAPLSLSATAAVVNGSEAGDDLKVHGDVLYVTGVIPPSADKHLHRFNRTTGALIGSTLLGVNNPNRLAVLPARGLVWISHADRYKASVYEIGTNTLRANFRVPLQIMPVALAASPDGRAVVALNLLCTLSYVDVAALEAAIPPSYALEIGNTLPPYRADAIKAYTDLLGVLAQSLKDAFCDLFLVECHECTKEDRIYLGTVEIRNRRVYHICNFSKRHYAKSFRTWSYWLSTVPVLPLIKRAFATLCCKIL